MDCGTVLIKYLLCLFNFIFFIAGTVVLGLGIWLSADKASFISLTIISNHETVQQFNKPSVIEQGAYILITVGAFVFIISFLGYCGAIKESKILLMVYGLFLIVILVLEVTVVVLAAVYKAEAEKETKGFLRFTLKEYYTTQEEADVLTMAWNFMMRDFHCCGVDNNTDFRIAKKWLEKKPSDRQLPVACCKLKRDPNKFIPEDSNCPTSPTEKNSYLKTGCYKQFLEWIKFHCNTAIGAAVVLGVIQLLGIIFAFCLCKAVEDGLK